MVAVQNLRQGRKHVGVIVVHVGVDVVNTRLRWKCNF